MLATERSDFFAIVLAALPAALRTIFEPAEPTPGVPLVTSCVTSDACSLARRTALRPSFGPAVRSFFAATPRPFFAAAAGFVAAARPFFGVTPRPLFPLPARPFF